LPIVPILGITSSWMAITSSICDEPSGAFFSSLQEKLKNKTVQIRIEKSFFMVYKIRSSNLTIWDSKNEGLKLNIQINNKSDFGHIIES